MEKIEFPKRNSKNDIFDKLDLGPETRAPSGQSKVPGLSNKAFAIVKFLLGICLLPCVYSYTLAFLHEARRIPFPYYDYFWSGALTFLLIYLFLFEPAKLYQKGQRLLEIVFHFFAPLVKVAPYLLPIYSIIIFFLYLVLSLFIKSKDLLNYSMFFFGFTAALHFVFSAKTLRSKQDFLKANYLFGFSLAYIINLSLISLLLSLIFEKFSFVNFFSSGFYTAGGIFNAVLKQLFGV